MARKLPVCPRLLRGDRGSPRFRCTEIEALPGSAIGGVGNGENGGKSEVFFRAECAVERVASGRKRCGRPPSPLVLWKEYENKGL